MRETILLFHQEVRIRKRIHWTLIQKYQYASDVPQHSERIVNDPQNRTIFDVLKKAHMDGYTNVRIVGGGDRVAEFEKLSNNYNGKLYAFDNVEVLSAGDRDPDGDDVSGMSASKQRKAAAEGDFATFRKGVPSSLNNKQARELYNSIRSAMNIKEGWNMWEIAPRFDWKNLRENFINENIYRVGHFVENLNTGLIGKIIRRGTNYLICVTEDKIMFKSWIKDVSEAVLITMLHQVFLQIRDWLVLMLIGSMLRKWFLEVSGASNL